MRQENKTGLSGFSRRIFLKMGGMSVATFGVVSNLFSSPAKLESTLKKMTAGVKPLTKNDYWLRIKKAQKLLLTHKMDGLLLTGGSNLKYFADMSWWRSERLFAMLINRKRDPIWICPAFELDRAKESIKFGTDIRTWQEHENPYKLVADAMKDLGAGAGVLGIGPTVRNFFVEGIRRQAPQLQVVDGSVVCHSCRSIKTANEIVYMDLANRITKLAYQDAFKKMREGMKPGELSQLTRQAHSQMGASGGGYPSFGQNSAFPHGSNYVRQLHKGQIVLIDGGCTIEGYRSDVTRTVVFGKPSDKQRRIFDIVLRAQQEAHKAIRPGKACESIDAVARKVITDAGYGPEYKYFAHRLGHGIGLDGHEYPYLVKGNTLKLKPGMTFSNEPGIYIYGEFGVRVEDCFVVTETGAKFLGGMLSQAIDKPFG